MSQQPLLSVALGTPEPGAIPAAGPTLLGGDRGRPLLELFVFGKPAPQGSKTRNKFGGVRDDNATTLHPWREAIKSAVYRLGDIERAEGPLAAEFVFSFDKPKSAPKTRRIWPITRSTFDIDKLVRACCDALTDAGAWRDDSQVIDLRARKTLIGDDPEALRLPGVRIRIFSIDGQI